MSSRIRRKDRDDAGTREAFAEKFFAPSQQPFRLTFGAATHTGKVRSNNEDHYAVVRRRRVCEPLLTNLPVSGQALVDEATFGMVVADGIGGENFGEFASQLALQRMFELSQQATSWVSRYTDPEVQQIRERVAAYVEKIQEAMWAHVQADPSLTGMGTTWTSAHLMPPHVLVVHIGDSRAYHLHENRMLQVTRDDTMAQVMIDSGMAPERVRKFGHLLTNSFGGNAEVVTAQIHQFSMSPGDRLLLCTDGLTDMVDDAQILAILRQTETPQAACDQLVNAALAHGGKDNVTVIVAAAEATD